MNWELRDEIAKAIDAGVEEDLKPRVIAEQIMDLLERCTAEEPECPPSK